MSIRVERADDAALASWDDHVARSPMGTAFHRLAVLRVLEAHSDSTLSPLVGYKGQEVVGLFPLFELSKGPVSTVFSPPPRLGVPTLGPVLTNYRKLKQRKRDRLNRRFVEGVLDWAADAIGPKYTHVETSVHYGDARPFLWREFDVTPKYTYEVDLSGGPDEVLGRFKSDLRSNVRGHDDADYRITRGGTDAIEFIIGQVRERYEAQDKTFPVDAAYVKDLYEAFPEGDLEPYVGEVDGVRESGIIVPRLGDRAHYWQGGVKPETSVPINDLIHWRIITDAIEDGVETYDLVGANTQRIATYKSRFNPTLAEYYEIERGTRTMNMASGVYRRLR